MLLGGLAATGAALGWIVRPLAERNARRWRDTPAAAAGVLGGLRTLAADLTWLQAYANWERRDLAATDSLLRLTTALDPEPLYFWLNGARIMAYDLPVWRVMAEGGFAAVPRERQAQIEEQQVRRALAFLEQARVTHPRASALWIEEANLQLNRRHDLAAAAVAYRRAAEMPDAPYYAARIYAELLRRLGRKQEALAWLEGILPTLPANNEAAAVEVLAERIRGLRSELQTEAMAGKR